MAKLIDITGKPLSGEWGTDDEIGKGIPVLRTTNFTNIGVIDYRNVVTRSISKKNLDEKFLRDGDIIIEKSGGSDKYPVGRVVYFDGEEKRFLFNNFTGVLRVKDKDIWYPRYVFYSLYENYRRGGTRPFENKTTGLHNLKIDDYVSCYEVKDNTYNKQVLICNYLDILFRIMKKREEQLEKMDKLIKARFVELFEEIKETCNIDYYIKELIAGKSFASEVECKNKVLKTGAVSFDYFDESQFKNLPINYEPKEEHLVHKGDIIISRMNTTELTGAAAYVWEVSNNVYIPDRLWKAVIREGVNPIFLWNMLIQPATKEQIKKVCSGTSGSMKNISKSGMLGIRVKKVDVYLQNKFATFVEEVNKSKVEVQKALDKAQLLFDSLMQKYFG